MPSFLDQATKASYHALVRQAEATWFPLLDNMPVEFWACDERYEMTYHSDAALHGLGSQPMTLEEYFGLEYGQVVSGDIDRLGEIFEELRTQVRFDGFCFEKTLKSGKRMIMLDCGVPVFDENDVFKGYHGISFQLPEPVNIAEETACLVHSLKMRAAELEQELSNRNAQLEENNKLLKEVLDAMGQGVMVTSGFEVNDPDNRVVMANPAYRDLFNLGEDEVPPGMPMHDVVARIFDLSKMNESRDEFAVVQGQISSGNPWIFDMKTLGRAVSIKATRRPSGGYVIVHTDVTELHARNMKLTKARDTALVASLAKSDFLAVISHEIRTPMNGIVGMTDLLAKTMLDSEQLEFVDTIRCSALALTKLISDILDFSKVEAGHVSLQSDLFDLHKVIRDACDLIQPLAQIKPINFNVTVAPEVARFVIGDAMRLRQILLNLLGNAVKFTLKGGVDLMVHVEGEKGQFVFEVCDTGTGIPKDKVDVIFTPFYQVDVGIQREFGGTGLGLSITRALVQAIGGTISVTSEVGQGSVFTLSLPFEESEQTCISEAVVETEHLDFSTVHVLVAEDNRTNQLVVRRMLERTGARITVALNGKEACAAYKKTRFDLVIMDISMPVMNGLEACKSIRKIEKTRGLSRCPVVALTGNAFEQDKEACEAAGMDDFLTKPVRLGDITQCLSRHLGDDQRTIAQNR